MPECTNHPAGTPSWMDLATTDLDGAKSFYATVFGWEFDAVYSGDELVYTNARTNGALVAGLMQIAPDTPMQSCWRCYIAVDDADKTTRRAVELGATVLLEPMDVMDAGRTAVIADPTGAVIALWQAHEHLGFGVTNEPGAFCWADCMTTDTERAIDFYCALFGWEAHTRSGGPMPYTEFSCDGVAVAGLMTLPPDALANGVAPYWGVYVAVADAEAALTTATNQGATTLWGPMGIAVGQMAGIMDPQGAVIAFIELASET
ncbi:MAG: VOC family protein [Acidimicrobiia bacterium]